METSREDYIPLATYQKLESKYIQVFNELKWLKRQLFGNKSERFIPNDQQLELNLGTNQDEVKVTKEEITYSRTITKKAAGHGRPEMPEHLPFKDIIIEPEEDVSNCEKIGDEISWEYEYDPGTLFVRRFIRPKYVDKKTDKITIGILPNRPIEKGNFGPGFMSSVTTDKYLYHSPLNRQREKFRNEFHTEFAESTFCDLIKDTVFWIEPVYELQKVKLLQSTYIQADETPIPVLLKTKKGKTHKGYYWVYYDPVLKNVIFEYRNGRGREGPNKFLKEYSGTLQVDGYTGYDELTKQPHIIRASCMAHVRRKFENALDYKRDTSEYALKILGRWFNLESEIKKASLTYEQRHDMRNANMKKEFSDFKKWMIEQTPNFLPKSPMRKAFDYALGQWGGFDPFFDDGRVELSNNLVENAIRPVALGRKNYMFKGSESAAQRGAIIYSVIATAKMHGKDPKKYIKILLEKLPNEKSKNLDIYLPWNFEL